MKGRFTKYPSSYVKASKTITVRQIAEEIHTYFRETGAETCNNTKILNYLISKGYDVSDVTNSEIDEAWDLQASWWDDEDETDSPVVLSDGMEIDDKSQAYAWLSENIEQHGNTYFWDGSLRRDLDKLIEKFGSTYFWR